MEGVTEQVGGADGARVMAGFGAATREWFTAAFAAPTPAQTGAWRSVAAGRNARGVIVFGDAAGPPAAGARSPAAERAQD